MSSRAQKLRRPEGVDQVRQPCIGLHDRLKHQEVEDRADPDAENIESRNCQQRRGQAGKPTTVEAVSKEDRRSRVALCPLADLRIVENGLADGFQDRDGEGYKPRDADHNPPEHGKQ